jgi:hypothetical protein
LPLVLIFFGPGYADHFSGFYDYKNKNLFASKKGRISHYQGVAVADRLFLSYSVFVLYIITY